MKSTLKVKSKGKFGPIVKEDEELSYFENLLGSGDETHSEEGEEEDSLSDEETHSNELNDGESETSEELKDEKKSAQNEGLIGHDEESEDEYTQVLENLTNQDLEMPIAKRMKMAFAKKKFDAKFNKAGIGRQTV